MRFSAKLEGERRLNRKLRQMASRTQAKILLKATREGAKPMLAEARRLAPEDTSGKPPKKGRRHGILKRGGLQIKATKRRKTYGETSVTSTVKGAHAALQELGVSKHVVPINGKPREHPGHPPQPFFKPAFENTKRKAARTGKGVLRQEILKAAK